VRGIAIEVVGQGQAERVLEGTASEVVEGAGGCVLGGGLDGRHAAIGTSLNGRDVVAVLADIGLQHRDDEADPHAFGGKR
jgi:hypothetical protein